MNLELHICCFGFNPRHSTLIIGSVILIVNISIIFPLLLSLIAMIFYYIASEGSPSLHEFADERSQQRIKLLLTTIPIALVIFIMNMVFTIILLVGAQEGKRGYVKAYLTFASVFIMICIAALIYYYIHNDDNIGSALYLIAILILIYFLLVIRSYYLKMENTEKPGVEKIA